MVLSSSSGCDGGECARRLPASAARRHAESSGRALPQNLMSDRTAVVLELGSWLGKSTRFIAGRAPNAYLFAIDLWDNDHIRADPHYTSQDAGGESGFMAHKAARSRQIEENLSIINTAPIYEVFLKNMWAQRPAALPGGAGGMVVGGVVSDSQNGQSDTPRCRHG